MAQQLLVAVDHNTARSRNGGQGAEGSEACLDGQNGYVLMGCCNKNRYDVKSKILILNHFWGNSTQYNPSKNLRSLS